MIIDAWKNVNKWALGDGSSFSLLPLGEGLGMRDYTSISFFLLCSVRGEWHSSTKKPIGIEAAVSPRPNPLPVGEGDALPYGRASATNSISMNFAPGTGLG